MESDTWGHEARDPRLQWFACTLHYTCIFFPCLFKLEVKVADAELPKDTDVVTENFAMYSLRSKFKSFQKSWRVKLF